MGKKKVEMTNVFFSLLLIILFYNNEDLIHIADLNC